MAVVIPPCSAATLSFHFIAYALQIFLPTPLTYSNCKIKTEKVAIVVSGLDHIIVLDSACFLITRCISKEVKETFYK